MKVKTSVILPDELLQEMEPYIPHYHSRSELIECAIRAFLAQLVREEQDNRELELINRYADELNQEALDVLGYQVPL